MHSSPKHPPNSHNENKKKMIFSRKPFDCLNIPSRRATSRLLYVNVCGVRAQINIAINGTADCFGITAFCCRFWRKCSRWLIDAIRSEGKTSIFVQIHVMTDGHRRHSIVTLYLYKRKWKGSDKSFYGSNEPIQHLVHRINLQTCELFLNRVQFRVSVEPPK